jgi:hypothetical protein
MPQAFAGWGRAGDVATDDGHPRQRVRKALSGCDIAHSMQAAREPLHCSELHLFTEPLRIVERFTA